MADLHDESSHRVYGYISEKIFYEMLNEAKREKIFTNEEGRVDIGALVAELVTKFSEGRIRVVPLPPIEKKELTEAVEETLVPETTPENPAPKPSKKKKVE